MGFSFSDALSMFQLPDFADSISPDMDFSFGDDDDLFKQPEGIGAFAKKIASGAKPEPFKFTDAIKGSAGHGYLPGGSDDGLADDPFLAAAVEKVESGGRANVVSPKGAWGKMQLMPDTAGDPGYGVKAFDLEAPDWSAENVRVGRDYLNAMRQKFGNDQTALIAYNWGPGNTEKWLAGGSNWSKLPAETRAYVEKVNSRLAGTAAPVTTAQVAGEGVPTRSLTPEEQVLSHITNQMPGARSVRTETILPDMPNTTDIAKSWPNTTTMAKNVPGPQPEPQYQTPDEESEVASASLPGSSFTTIVNPNPDYKAEAEKKKQLDFSGFKPMASPKMAGAAGSDTLAGGNAKEPSPGSVTFQDAIRIASMPSVPRQMQTVVPKGGEPTNQMVDPLAYELAAGGNRPANDITEPYTIPQTAINMLPGGHMWGPLARAAGLTTVSADTAQTAKDTLYGGIMPGVSANFGDELGAGAIAPIDYAANVYAGTPDASLGGSYDKWLTEARRQTEEAQARSPTASTLGELGGAGVGLLAAGPEYGAASLGGLIGRGALEGAAYGGISGAGAGEGMYDRLTGAAVGTAVGGTLGAGIPVVGGLAAKATAPLRAVYRGIRQPEQEAANFVRSAIAENNKALTGMEFELGKRSGQPLANVERGGEATRELARTAANLSPQARAALDERVNTVAQTSGDRISSLVDNVVGGANAVAERDTLKAQAAAILKPRYDRARAQGDTPIANMRLNVSPEMKRLQTSPDIQRAMSRAAENAEGRAVAEGGKAPTRKNLQYWDYVKRELDDEIGEAQRRGVKDRVDVLTQQKKALVNELDRIVPSYSAARSKAAEYFDAADALEAGQKFISKGVNYNEAEKVINAMSRPERLLFRKGFADSLLRQIEQAPDKAGLVRKIFGSEDARKRMKLALGPDAYNKVAAHLKVEEAMGMLKNAVQGNSTTARQLLSSRLLNYGAGPLGGLAYDETLGAGIMDPVGLLLAGGIAGGGHVATRKVSGQIAKMLLADDPKLYAKGITFLTKHKDLLRNLHRLTATLSTAGTQASARGREGGKDISRVSP